MYLFVTVLHIILSIFLVLIILLQPGKGADVGAAFGGGGGGGMFGPRGPATLLSRATTGVAVLFMVTSVSLALMSDQTLLSDAELDRLLGEVDETDYAMPSNDDDDDDDVDDLTPPDGPSVGD
ncbi:MAG: preprotein translocase subunit SecG [Deltaproteobacteria bacterium]|nr:MAG: preprotein translocase subunit SecG [Deltaproteobacteria bacterium]